MTPRPPRPPLARTALLAMYLSGIGAGLNGDSRLDSIGVKTQGGELGIPYEYDIRASSVKRLRGATSYNADTGDKTVALGNITDHQVRIRYGPRASAVKRLRGSRSCNADTGDKTIALGNIIVEQRTMSNIGGDEQHRAITNDADSYTGTNIDPIILSPNEDCGGSTRATTRTAGSMQHDDSTVCTLGIWIMRKICRGPTLQPKGEMMKRSSKPSNNAITSDHDDKSGAHGVRPDNGGSGAHEVRMDDNGGSDAHGVRPDNGGSGAHEVRIDDNGGSGAHGVRTDSGGSGAHEVRIMMDNEGSGTHEVRTDNGRDDAHGMRMEDVKTPMMNQSRGASPKSIELSTDHAAPSAAQAVQADIRTPAYKHPNTITEVDYDDIEALKRRANFGSHGQLDATDRNFTGQDGMDSIATWSSTNGKRTLMQLHTATSPNINVSCAAPRAAQSLVIDTAGTRVPAGSPRTIHIDGEFLVTGDRDGKHDGHGTMTNTVDTVRTATCARVRILPRYQCQRSAVKQSRGPTRRTNDIWTSNINTSRGASTTTLAVTIDTIGKHTPAAPSRTIEVDIEHGMTVKQPPTNTGNLFAALNKHFKVKTGDVKFIVGLEQTLSELQDIGTITTNAHGNFVNDPYDLYSVHKNAVGPLLWAQRNCSIEVQHPRCQVSSPTRSALRDAIHTVSYLKGAQELETEFTRGDEPTLSICYDPSKSRSGIDNDEACAEHMTIAILPGGYIEWYARTLTTDLLEQFAHDNDYMMRSQALDITQRLRSLPIEISLGDWISRLTKISGSNDAAAQVAPRLQPRHASLSFGDPRLDEIEVKAQGGELRGNDEIGSWARTHDKRAPTMKQSCGATRSTTESWARAHGKWAPTMKQSCGAPRSTTESWARAHGKWAPTMKQSRGGTQSNTESCARVHGKWAPTMKQSRSEIIRSEHDAHGVRTKISTVQAPSEVIRKYGGMTTLCGEVTTPSIVRIYRRNDNTMR